jgi:hypothetical protein
MPLDVILYGGFLPAAAALLILLSASPWRIKLSAWHSPTAGLAVVGAYWVGHLSQLGLSFRPTDIVQWLPWVALVGGCAAFGESLIRQGWRQWLIRIVAALFLSWVLLHPLTGRGMLLYGQWIWFVGGIGLVTAATVLLWAIFWRLTRGENGPILPLSLIVLVVGSSAVLALSGTAVMAQLSGALITALGIVFLLSWRFGNGLEFHSLSGPLALILVAQWGIGLLYAEMTVSSLSLLLFAPFLLLITRAPRLRQTGRLVAYLVHLFLVALPVSGAVGFSAMSYFHESAASSSAPATGNTGDSKDEDEPDYDYDVD